MRALVFVVAALCFATIAFGQSPPKTAPKVPNKEQQTTERQNASAPPTINVTVQAPEPDPAIAKEQRDDAKRNLEIQEAIGNATFYIAIATVVQVLASFAAFLVGLRAANAAKKSADTAAASLQLADRPWVNPRVLLNGPLVVTPDGDVKLTLLIELNNVGRSVAQHVDMKLFLLPLPFNTLDVAEQRRTIWEGFRNWLKDQEPDLGFTLFPGDKPKRLTNITVAAQRLIEVWTQYESAVLVRPMSERPMRLVLFGTISYSQNIKTENRRSTSFGYEVLRVDPVNPTEPIGLVAATTQMEDLRLVVSPIGLHHAE